MKSALRQILANNIKQYRIKLGLSQEKLSEILDVHRNTIAMLESQQRGISMELLEKLAITFKCHAYELLIPSDNSATD